MRLPRCKEAHPWRHSTSLTLLLTLATSWLGSAGKVNGMQNQRLTNIEFRPGIVKEQSTLAAGNYWTDADKIRFRFGKPELIGGWQNTTTAAEIAKLLGVPRTMQSVRTLSGIRAALVGTHVGLFSTNLSGIYDVTPFIANAQTSARFNTTLNSRSIVVSLSAHGMTNETIVGFTSANTTIGGNILLAPTTALATYQVSIISANSFEIQASVSAAATSAGTVTSATTFLAYPAGTRSNANLAGWGTGAWGGPFGWSSSPLGALEIPLRLWSFDLWGTEIMAVPNGGPLIRWNPNTLGIAERAVIVTAAPSINDVVRVASEARHAVLYGTHDNTGVYDPLLIRWCSSEDFTDWTPSLTNTAGDIRLNSQGSKIINVAKIGSGTLILTNADAFEQRYIGAPDVFGFTRTGENCGLIARNALVEYNSNAYWMGNNGQFFSYTGRLQTLPCTVLRYVFQNLNIAQKDKIAAGVNSEFDEIIWFYPTTTNENDSYVIYNTVEQHWTIGRLGRTFWLDRSTFDEPVAAGAEGEGLFYHEIGHSDGANPLHAYLESSYFDLQDGDTLLFSNKIVPDFVQPTGAPISGIVNMFIKARQYPNGPVVTKGPFAVDASTQKISTRVRGRELSLRIESAGLDQPWRLGDFRLALQPDGFR